LHNVQIGDALVRSLGFGRAERPPLLWDIDCTEAALRALLNDMVQASGQAPRALVVNLSNMTVPAGAADERLPEGEYVAVSVLSEDGWGRDDTWSRSDPVPTGALGILYAAACVANAQVAYTRALGGSSSITVLLPRAD
jgi:hypothetical protein